MMALVNIDVLSVTESMTINDLIRLKSLLTDDPYEADPEDAVEGITMSRRSTVIKFCMVNLRGGKFFTEYC